MGQRTDAGARRRRKRRERVPFYPGQKIRSGGQLKTARTLAGLSQAQFSKLSGIGINAISRMEGQNRIVASRAKLEPLEQVLEAAGIEIFVTPHPGARVRDEEEDES